MREDQFRRFDAVRTVGGEILTVEDGWEFDLDLAEGAAIIVADNRRDARYVIPWPTGVEYLIYSSESEPYQDEDLRPPARQQPARTQTAEREPDGDETHTCPEHDIALRKGKGDYWFCPKKIGSGDKDYCEYTYRPGEAQPQQRQEPADTRPKQVYMCPKHDIAMRRVQDAGRVVLSKEGGFRRQGLLRRDVRSMTDMRTLRVNDLENWRFHIMLETPEEDFIERFSQTHERSGQALAGKAFHTMLRDEIAGASHIPLRITIGDTTFLLSQEFFRGDFSHPMQVNGEMTYPDLNLRILGKAHMLDREGGTLFEHKATWAQTHVQRFRRSYQWRYHMRMFGCDRIVYRAWRLREVRPQVHRVIYHDEHEWTAYDGMDDELFHMARSLVEFLDKRDLWSQRPQDVLPVTAGAAS